MSTVASYTEARSHLAELLDEVVTTRDVVYITRRNHPKVALIAADELQSLQETAHLLRSPRNAVRLLTALQRALAQTEAPQCLADLRQEVGLGQASPKDASTA